MAKLTLATGKKTYEIEDEHGEPLCNISFNTTDLNMMNRLSKMEDKVKEVISAIPDFKTSQDIENFFLSGDVIDADQKVRAILDEAFDSEICDKLFGNTNCLSIATDGTTPVERFLNMIGPVITSDYKEAMEASEKRVSKYTSQVK